MKKIKIVTIVLILTSVSFYGQSVTSKDLVNTFFTAYKNDAGKAVRDLYKTNVWAGAVKKNIDKIVTTVNGFTKQNMGEYYGFEPMKIKKISESYELHTYLVKYGRQPLRYIFKFYKPKDKWLLYSFSLDDGVDKEL